MTEFNDTSIEELFDDLHTTPDRDETLAALEERQATAETLNRLAEDEPKGLISVMDEHDRLSVPGSFTDVLTAETARIETVSGDIRARAPEQSERILSIQTAVVEVLETLAQDEVEGVFGPLNEGLDDDGAALLSAVVPLLKSEHPPLLEAVSGLVESLFDFPQSTDQLGHIVETAPNDLFTTLGSRINHPHDSVCINCTRTILATAAVEPQFVVSLDPTSISNLVDNLDSSRREIRTLTVTTLRQLADADGEAVLATDGVVDALLPLLEDPEDNVRNMSLSVLLFLTNADGEAVLTTNGVVDALIPLLKDSEDDVQTTALAVLVQLANTDGEAVLATDGVVDALLPFFEDPEDNVRASALAALKQLADANGGAVLATDGVVNALLPCLEDSEDSVRNMSLAVLEQLARA
ncbi:HEAT repeat domain-containing protein, partial [Haloarcula sediminis]|uniref:HEAT repeat domain-containing protein n=1 Tax=Haloarcula sediminis TaxID=3111777 RepID=UPI002D77C169